MVKAVVAGAGGKMGGRIITMIGQTEGIFVAGAVESRHHPLVGKDVGESLGLGKIGVTVTDDMGAALAVGDVVIDFTSHEASMDHLALAAEKGKAIVIGSTGFTSAEAERAAQICNAGARCVLAPNMSIGVNVMYRVLADVARILGSDYDVEIVEAHHNAKKDAPSGTALMMAQTIAEALGRDLGKVGVFARKGMIGARTAEEIGIQTVRAGDIVGEHTVIFGGQGERLEFIHRAHSRDNFARGAILAARWIIAQESGLYDMKDVLGLRY